MAKYARDWSEAAKCSRMILILEKRLCGQYLTSDQRIWIREAQARLIQRWRVARDRSEVA